MSRHRRYATAIAVLLLASPLAAQEVSPDTLAVSVTPVAAPAITRSAPDPLALVSPARTPTWVTAAAAVPASTRVATARTFFAPQSSESAAMMIVGGAAMLVGAIIADKPGTILMVSGGVLGLVGLWRYAR
jgi:hypothetical protein